MNLKKTMKKNWWIIAFYVAFYLCVLVTVVVLISPTAKAEQHAWSFTAMTGGIGSQSTIYASLSFPSNQVAKENTFWIQGVLHSSTTTDRWIYPQALKIEGCTVEESQLLPFNNVTNRESFRFKLKMVGENCSFSIRYQLQTSGGTVIWNHPMSVTVPSQNTIEVGGPTGLGLTKFTIPFVAFLVLLGLGVQTGNVFWFIPGMVGALVILGLNLGVTITFLLALAVLGFAFPYLKNAWPRIMGTMNKQR